MSIENLIRSLTFLQIKLTPWEVVVSVAGHISLPHQLIGPTNKIKIEISSTFYRLPNSNYEAADLFSNTFLPPAIFVVFPN